MYCPASRQTFRTHLTETLSIGNSDIDIARLIDFETPDNNDWLAMTNTAWSRAATCTGPPNAFLERKNAAAEKASTRTAIRQVQTDEDQLTQFFVFNELMVISDDLNACIGPLMIDHERCLLWRLARVKLIAS